MWPGILPGLGGELQHALQQKLLPEFRQVLEEQEISPGAEIIARFTDLYLPFSAWLATQHTNQPVVIGINGAQGSGKSTLTHILARLLNQGFGKRVVTLSIDDLYKTRLQRQQMAETVHPLFITRGVPGTHDIEMGSQIFSTLKNKHTTDEILLPRFNKATDDRYEKENWNSVHLPVDIILFEGWCVGAVAEDEEALITDINPLEAKEDPDKIWRKYVNRQLAGPYQELFSYIDILIMLEIPHMKHVYRWRTLQEQKLEASLSSEVTEKSQQTMSEEQLERFIMHYERITRATLKEMPYRADIVMKLSETHQIAEVIARVN